MSRLRSASLWRVALLCLCQALVILGLACGSSTKSPAQVVGGSDTNAAGGGGGGGGEVAMHGGAAESDDSLPAASLLELELEPAEGALLVDGTLSLGVVGVYSNGEREDVRSRAQLVSSDRTVVSLNGYRLTALSPGEATVTATLFGVSGSAHITVLPKSITALTVTAAQASFSLGEAVQARAEALLDDGSRQDVTALATWSSSDLQVARLNIGGFLIAMGRGVATITATVGEVSGSVEQTVTGESLTTYAISGAHVMRVGDRSFLQLQSQYGSGRLANEGDAIWQTSDPSVLSLTTGGQLAAVSAGTATISAILGVDVAASVDVVVTAAVLTSLELEGSRVFGFCEPPLLRAIGTFSDGSSYNVSAWLDGGAYDGKVEVVSLGSEGMSLVPKELGDFELEVAVGELLTTAQFTIVLGSPTRMVLEETRPFPVAASTRLSVLAYCTDDGPSIDATKIVSWSSEDPTVAGVVSAGGAAELIGLRPGNTYLQATYPGFEIEPISVSVFAGTPTELRLWPEAPDYGVGSEFPMQASARYDDQLYDVTRSCAWSTSNALAATISNAEGSKGFVTFLRVGSGSIGAKFGALSASVTFNVQ